MKHSHFLHRCLKLAEKGRGLVGINPLVGAVIVRDGKVIAEGCYMGPGTDHAEVAAVETCQWRVSTADILYVNLEPCNHHGNTPPCTQAIINAGIKHVIYGMQDPDERVQGSGIRALREEGITVEGPICRAECERLNRGYISLRTKGRPYITLKKAQTIDGKVANNDGTKLCITSDTQNEWSHTYLRAKHDGILVGVGTVITDNPQLTIRNTKYNIPDTNQPIRIILDPDLRIPLEAKVVGEGTIIIVNEEMLKSRNVENSKLEAKGATIVGVPMIDDHFDWGALWEALSTIHYPLSSILVEGGPATWAQFKEARIVDEEVVLIG